MSHIVSLPIDSRDLINAQAAFCSCISRVLRATLIRIQLKCRHAQDQVLRVVNLRYYNAFKDRVDLISIEDTLSMSARFV